MAGMKKLVPSDLVQDHHDGADEQGGKGQQRQDGGHENAPYRQGQAHQRHPPRARLQHGHHVVQAAHGEADDEESQGNEHQNDSPARPRSAVEDGLGRVQGPAGTRGPAGHEEARHQQQHGEQIDPVTHHVDIGENHVAGADHQRDEVVAETPQEQRGEQVDDHDHAVHGDELKVVARVDKGKDVREPQLQPHDPRQHQGHQPHRDRGDRVLDGDDFGVLAPDVLPDESFRMVELRLLDFGRWGESRFVMRNVSH